MIILCATTNKEKFSIGKAVCAQHNIVLEQIILDITEIQAETGHPVITDKATKAFAATGQPVLVTDDTWDIPGLGGFPGPYMKSINHWFTTDDYARLTKGLVDRRIILHQNIAYIDDNGLRIFSKDIFGTIVRTPRGTFGPPNMQMVALDADNGKTISQTYDAGIAHDPDRLQRRGDAWLQFAGWYSESPV